jgi:hypothetical protein
VLFLSFLNRLILITALFIAASFPQSLLAQGRLAFFYLDYSDSVEGCEFFEIGKASKDNYFEFPAAKSKFGKSCVASIDSAIFNQHFSFCALSSISTNPVGTSKCVFEGSSSTFNFVAGVTTGQGRTHCEFVCTTKTDGNKTW